MTPRDDEELRSIVDGVNEITINCERKWGVGRLELLVSDDLRIKFREQLKRYHKAVLDREPTAARKAGEAVKRAWTVLDQAATASGARELELEIWEIELSDGRVVALTRGRADAFAAFTAGRLVDVWTTEEIRLLIEKFPEVAIAKQSFPGAAIVSARAKLPAEDEVLRAVEESEG